MKNYGLAAGGPAQRALYNQTNHAYTHRHTRTCEDHAHTHKHQPQQPQGPDSTVHPTASFCLFKTK